MHHCKSCGKEGTGKFCSACGQSYSVKRITLSTILHDVFHFFTHLEKGFGYTLRQLCVAPGAMQREYVEGVRSRHQKPFSMFFICASANAVARYWIQEGMVKYYHQDAAEATLRHEYQLLLLLIALPVISLIMWLLFKSSKYNYAEIGVLELYLVSFVLIAIIPITCLKFIWPAMDTAWIEFPLFVAYGVITTIRFFPRSNPWASAVKSVIATCAFFFCFQLMEDFVIGLIRTRHIG